MNQHVQQRQIGPDYAKMIGIVLVVWGHTIRGLIAADILPSDSAFWINLDRAIYLFHMPLFFVLSGMFIQQTVVKTDLTDFFKRNVLIFLLPLIFWSYAQISIQYAASSSINVQRSLDYLLLAPFPPKQQFWFLWALFLISCFSAVILKANHGKTLLTVLAVAVIGILSVGANFSVDNISYKMAGMTFGEAVFFFPYFVLGVYLSPSSLIQAKSTLLLYVGLFITTICFYLFLYQESNTIYYLFSLFAVYTSYKCIAYMGEWIQNRVSESETSNGWLRHCHRFFIFVGMNSFIIYLAHIIPEAGSRVVLMKLGISDPLIHIVAGNVAGLLLPLLLVPINVFLVRYWKSANYLIPVRRLKYE